MEAEIKEISKTCQNKNGFANFSNIVPHFPYERQSSFADNAQLSSILS